MTDASRPSSTRAAGVRWGVISVLLALAFLAGLVLAGYLLRQGRWMATAPTATPDVGVPAAAPLVAAPAGQPAAPADVTALAAREEVLAAQLSALEVRAAAVTADATAAGGEAGRAEALLVAGAARRALDHGAGLGYLDAELRARFGAARPRAVQVVAEVARAPVTLEDLRQGLDALGPQLVSEVDRGWGAAIAQELTTLVVLRRAGTPSPLPADRLERARGLMAGGQVEAARAEVARLPGAAAAANWLSAARRYVLARQALDALENAALQGQAARTPTPPPLLAPIAPAVITPTAR